MSKRKLCLLLLMLAALVFTFVVQTIRSTFLFPYGSLENFVGRASQLQVGERFQLRKKDEGTSKIILMTYGRSGSTLTSEIIRQDPNVFYTFEPLYNLMKRHMGKGGSSPYLVLEKDNYDKESIDIIEVFLTCSFESMNSADINNYQLHNAVDSRLLYSCVEARRKWTLLMAVDCFINARKACLQRPVKLVKTIRLRGSAAKVLMERNPDLRILYLIRDPRGTITSQQRVFRNFKWDNVSSFATDYCQTFREDLAEMGKLIDRFPNRVKLLRYESLAENPLQASEEMYRFLGLNFSDSVRTFVFIRTMAGKTSNAYGTARKNSTLTAYMWRTTLTVEAALSIDQSCQDVYQALGYLPVKTVQELKNLSRPLRTPAVFHGQVL